jgi:TPP-dependent pyruvate/acetoin dehydrogenase alpha subunit
VLLADAAAPKKSAPDWSAEAILDQVPCIPADGNDLVALYRVAQESMTRARQQGGPTLIDCKHIALSPNDSNPLARMEAHLERKGLLPAGRRQQLTDGFHRELQQARSALPALTRQHKRG